MTSDQVIELLQSAYNDEIETVMNYLTNATVLDGVSAEEVKESLRTDAKQEELIHAERIGKRLRSSRQIVTCRSTSWLCTDNA